MSVDALALMILTGVGDGVTKDAEHPSGSLYLLTNPLSALRPLASFSEVDIKQASKS